jgi:hypothetical protein
MRNKLAQVQAQLRASELAQVTAKTADAPRAHPPFRAGLPEMAYAAPGFTFGGVQAAAAQTAAAPPPPAFTFGRAPAESFTSVPTATACGGHGALRTSADLVDADGAIQRGEPGDDYFIKKDCGRSGYGYGSPGEQHVQPIKSDQKALGKPLDKPLPVRRLLVAVILTFAVCYCVQGASAQPKGPAPPTGNSAPVAHRSHLHPTLATVQTPAQPGVTAAARPDLAAAGREDGRPRH